MQPLQLPALAGRPRLGELEAWALAQGWWPLIGADEAGRGPLAGPVVAAAVVLSDGAARGGDSALAGLDDSKRLTPVQREGLVPAIQAAALAWHIEPAWEDEIAARNILHASLAAMQRACLAVAAQLEAAQLAQARLVALDGNQLLPAWTRSPQVAVVKGDARSRTIAAASVLAKVWRDKHMEQLDGQYPGYGFAVHKGYPTPAHLEALRRLGPSAVHRRGFGPVAALQPSLFGDDAA